MPYVLSILVASGFAVGAFAQTTAPAASAATSVPSVEMLDGGRVRIVPPPGWTLTRRADNGMALRYDFGNGEGIMSVIVSPQTSTLTRDSAAQMAKAIGKQLRDVARRDGSEFLIPPRVESDDRFLLKVRDRTRGGDGKARDQLQIYRQIGLNLIHVAIVATVEGEDASRPIFAAGETLLDTAKAGFGAKPAAYRKTRIRLTIPIDWVEQRTDDPNGVVATFANPAYPGARLVVRSRIIPKREKGNADVQRSALDMLLDDHRNAAMPEGAEKVGKETSYDATAFVRGIAWSIKWNGQPWGVDFRCAVVGDVAVGVEALVPPLDKTVSKLADEMAQSIRPLSDRTPAGGSAQSMPAREGPMQRIERPPVQGTSGTTRPAK